MLLVRKPDGSPWLFVAAAPVSHGEYAAARPQEKEPQKRKKLNAQPVVQVAYGQAESYAREKGARLPTPDEWAAAATTAGFKPAGKLAEWVDDGSVGQQAPREVRRPPRPGREAPARPTRQRHVPPGEGPLEPERPPSLPIAVPSIRWGRARPSR